ncbi:hypothetical protein [Burkholderia multivorans]|nr:hypothetical protein [Burkholderia multivorans]MBU9391379.1 hypothetical protein [Burkholderia multivorans]MBY4795826.1 hypothetical protein [Burkholderia multivorans]
MPAEAWTDEWAHARRCARIGYGGMRARGVAPLAFVEHAARAFQSHVMRGIRQTAVACASAGEFRGLVDAHRPASQLSGAFRPIAALLAHFSPASLALLAHFLHACSPLLACFALRSATIRRRSRALRRGSGVRYRRTGKMRAFFARHRGYPIAGPLSRRCDRAPRLYRRSYPRYYNPPIAEQ